MQKFAKLSYYAFVLSAFMLFSCGKDDDTVADPAQGTNNPGNQKCVLTEVDYLEDGDSFQTIFEYDNNRRPTKVIYKENGAPDNYSEIFEYNAAGQLSKSTEMNGTAVEGFDLYFYNNDGLLVRREVHYDNGGPIQLQGIKTYEYNADKKLIKASRANASQPTVITDYSIFTYPTATTAREESFYATSASANPTLQSTTLYTFGDKKSINSGILGVWMEDEILSPNNVISEVWTDVTSPGSTPETVNYTYVFNADGYPTKVTFDYGGPSTEEMNLSYNCQ